VIGRDHSTFRPLAFAGVQTRALDETTWPAFAALVERHNGVWGGCWCMGFHAEGPKSYENRARKHARVLAGDAHAALVFDAEDCIGWCQFGSPQELPRIKRQKAYGSPPLPDWRVTCFFVDRTRRRSGVADAALGGAVELIAAAGGGVVESYPDDVEGRKISGSFLHNASVQLFERHGFTRERRLGKHHWVVTRVV
jgi:GNAT superfamily N-acetyltransferase